MLKNYIKTAIRNLLRQAGITVINLCGLTLAITCSLVLFLLVRHQTSYDNYHSKADRVWRVVSESDANDGKNYSSGVPSVLAPAFRNDFPEAEEVVFMSYRADALITIPQPGGAEPKKYQEEAGVVYTESGFFNLLDRKVLVGDGPKALDEPNEAVISKRSALKYFGKEDAVGEVVKFNDREYKIGAVMEDFPTNTDFPFDVMLSYITIQKENEENGWNSTWSDEHCYFLMKENETAENINRRLEAFAIKYIGKDDPDRTRFTLQPLSDIHYNDRYGTFTYATSDPKMLFALSIIGLVLIVTGCINFINLSTAEAIKRSKEVGIRKSLGSTRAQLVRQFLGETTMITLVAVILSIALAQLALTFLNPFMELQLSFNLSHDPLLWIYLGGVTLVVSLLAGLYPAFVVSGFNPVLALKNVMSYKNSSGYTLRRSLVVVQFMISQFLIMGTIVVVNQITYFHKKDLGFRKDAVLVIPIPESEKPAETEGNSKMRTLREQVSNLPGVELASLNSAPPASGSVSNTLFMLDGSTETFRTQIKAIDVNYVDLFGVELLAGNNVLDLDTAQGYLVNEKLAHTAGFAKPTDMIGKVVHIGSRHMQVVGVMRDFHTESLRNPIEPVIMMNRISRYETLALRINPTQVQEVIAGIKPLWEHAYPQHIFSYDFLDQQIAEFYDSEKRMSVLLTIFSSIAIFIGCLGLFGLATFMANQRTKEVGVRKVMGASVESIVFLFSREYVKLILIGFVLAAPLMWWFMSAFLSEFTYKVSIGPDVYITGLISTLIIAMITVGYKSIRAATVNPVKSLRSE